MIGHGLLHSLRPETGEGFVVAAVFGVLPAGGFVVARDGAAEAVERRGGILPEPGGGEVKWAA